MSSRNRSRRNPRPTPRSSRASDDAPAPADHQVVVGRVIRNHGLDGALRIKCHSDNPQRFQAGNSVTVGNTERAIVSCQSLPGEYAILRLDGIVDVQTAQLLAGQWLYAATDSGPELPPGEYYHYQLVGLQVTTDEGENLGQIREVLITGSNDVYVVESSEGAEILLPAVHHVVKQIDIAAGQVLVHLINGLR